MAQLDHRQVIAIDGPGAAGKSTVAKILADRTGAMMFDTGALYRAVTLASIRDGIEGSDGDVLASLAETLRIEVRSASIEDGRQVDVLLDGEDVTWEIRTPEIDAQVSEVSAYPAVREALLAVQQDIANGARIVMVGRDIGTVVIPSAGLKIFLEASARERARRRLIELQGRGIEASYDDVLIDLEARDEYDSSREAAPLVAATDAVIVPTDGRTIEDIVDELERLTVARWQETGVVSE